ncbi:helix-turn-helix domain-containing protein [Nostoc ellipsosporum NOK]|nr:helix-turn-helix domain-containing protein [Nostoc ellipsosporum NOK]
MPRKKIPVYDICTLAHDQHQDDFFIERFADYIRRHYDNLHHAHGHSFYHLVYFTKGSGTHSIDFDRFDVKPGQIYFMAPGQVHSWHFKGDTDGYIINFSENFFRTFLLNPDYLDKFSFFGGHSEDCVCQLPPAIRDTAVDLFRQMLAQHTTADRDMLRVLLLRLFLLVREHCTKKSAPGLPKHKQTLLTNFRSLINQYYKTIRLPKEYADLLYVTPNHLNALCQDMLGKTAGELIRDRIILEAKRLLVNADMSVTEIAYELNFQDNSYFNRFFRKYTGSTPDSFRKQYTHVK